MKNLFGKKKDKKDKDKKGDEAAAADAKRSSTVAGGNYKNVAKAVVASVEPQQAQHDPVDPHTLGVTSNNNTNNRKSQEPAPSVHVEPEKPAAATTQQHLPATPPHQPHSATVAAEPKQSPTVPTINIAAATNTANSSPSGRDRTMSARYGAAKVHPVHFDESPFKNLPLDALSVSNAAPNIAVVNTKKLDTLHVVQKKKSPSVMDARARRRAQSFYNVHEINELQSSMPSTPMMAQVSSAAASADALAEKQQQALETSTILRMFPTDTYETFVQLKNMAREYV